MPCEHYKKGFFGGMGCDRYFSPPVENCQGLASSGCKGWYGGEQANLPAVTSGADLPVAKLERLPSSAAESDHPNAAINPFAGVPLLELIKRKAALESRHGRWFGGLSTEEEAELVWLRGEITWRDHLAAANNREKIAKSNRNGAKDEEWTVLHERGRDNALDGSGRRNFETCVGEFQKGVYSK